MSDGMTAVVHEFGACEGDYFLGIPPLGGATV